MISVQPQDFDHCAEYEWLRTQSTSDGAIVTFTGIVRDFSSHEQVSAIELEHYPGMTEQYLENISEQAKTRWQLGKVRVIHRIGVIESHQQIVFVGVTSRHRKAAFEACEFIMDHLKNKVPLWKREYINDDAKWVDAKETDKVALKRWL